MIEQCSCGRWYATAAGVSMCQANRHGKGIDRWDDHAQFNHTIDLLINHECGECGEMLTSKRTKRGETIVFQVMPHICQINAPE